MERVTSGMATFVKARCGGDDVFAYAINMEKVESVDMTNRRVWMVACSKPFHVKDDDAWERIMAYIDAHEL